MKNFLLTTTTLALAASFAAPALAQETSEDELRQTTVTVTVQKRAENLRDVPVAVSAVDSELLDDLGLDEFSDVARFVPGFEVQEQSPNNPGFVIRGITSDSGESNIEPRIAIFQDGVSISRSRGSVVELFDLERVEVAKGPQPTLFGRGALIGGVNVIQAKPEFEFSGQATAGIGNYDEVYLDGYVTGPIVEDTLAFRIAGRLRERDGYVESVNPDEEDFNSQDMSAVRASLAFTPTADLRFDLIANYQEDSPSGTSFKSMAFLPEPNGSAAPWDPANLNTFGNFLGGKPLGLEREVTNVTLLGDWQVSDYITLSSITGYREFDSLEVFDPDGFGLDLLIFGEDASGEQFSQELRANYDAGGRVRGFIGASYFDESGKQNVPLTFDERAVQALLGGFLTPPNAPPASAFPGINLTVFQQSGGTVVVPLKPIHNERFVNDGETQAFEVFTDATFDVTDRLQLTGGLRYTTEDKESGLLVELLNGPSALTGAGLFVQPSGGRIARSETFDDLTWRAAAKFELTDSVNLFANYARGRRPEVITASASAPAAGFAILDAEIVDAYEVGAKSSLLGGDLSLEASAFYYEYNNFQSTQINAQGLIEPINAGDATAEGFEAQANWYLSDALNIIASYGYNYARFDDEPGAPFGGNKLRLSPDHKASLAARIFLMDAGFGTLSLVPSYTWQSQVYFDNTERELISQEAYGLVNLNVQLDLENGFGVEAYVNNLTGEDYIIDAGNTGDGFGIPTFIAGTPTFYGARIRKSF
ncbi:TonB-dependent receptor [Henriciella algicola]|uniref:TonB-dependent receptor n=1 Tax=Henriciella algicola TaxID=1608422 RepID=A0A399RLW0_9PROT|nr:TonB-dependent receptor [Henriciella algicola]RIJ31274.1 TonB-dependent receptor [Henriciella algicola]